MDPVGETLDTRVLVVLRRVDLERLANISKLPECALEQCYGKLGVVDGERFLVGLLLLLLGRWLLPLLLDGQLPATVAFVVVVLPSSLLLRLRVTRHHAALLLDDLSVTGDCGGDDGRRGGRR